jgi:hypothetical protein
MHESLNKSGYLLEQRIRRVLVKRERGYYVETNAAYPDPQTGISREYDIAAVSAVPLSRDYTNALYHYIICECENNAQPVVFFETESQISLLHHEQLKYSGIPLKLWSRGRFVGLSHFLDLDKFHHYCKGPFATQYCSFSRKNTNAPWIASHSEQHHETITALINAVEAEITKHYENWTPPRNPKDEGVNIQIYNPLLVLQGELYLARGTKRGVALSKAQHIQYRREVWTAKHRENYQVDVITESYMPQYLELIEKEIDSIKRRLRRKWRVVRNSFDRIITQAKKDKRQGVTLREIFEP